MSKLEVTRINDRKDDKLNITVSSELVFQTRDVKTNYKIQKLGIENDIKHLMNNSLAHINLFIITQWKQAVADGKVSEE